MNKVVNKNNLVDYIMGFEDGSLTTVDIVDLFSYLIKTGQAWHLQGMYGRYANDLINNDIIDKKGKILKDEYKSNN